MSIVFNLVDVVAGIAARLLKLNGAVALLVQLLVSRALDVRKYAEIQEIRTTMVPSGPTTHSLPKLERKIFQACCGNSPPIPWLGAPRGGSTLSFMRHVSDSCAKYGRILNNRFICSVFTARERTETI